MFLFFLWGALLDRRIHDRALAAWTGTGKANRLKSFQESLHGRYGTAALLVVPGVAAILLLAVAVLLTRDMFLGILAGLLGGLILIVELPIAIWWFVLWRIGKKSQTAQVEIRGPALLFANRMRTWKVTAGSYRFFARHILPSLFAFTLIALAIYGASRISFDFMQSAEWVCEGGYGTLLAKEKKPLKFDIDAGCTAAQTQLKEKTAYQITVFGEGNWSDGGVPVSVNGISTYDIGWAKFLQLPLRRKLAKSWFVVIARIGETGDEEYALKSGPNSITPTKTGQLYLFVNEAVIGLPDYDRFYRHNKGTVTIEMQRSTEVE